MALYDYECKIHGVFEAIQKMKDLPLKECPKCVAEGKVSEPPKKLISKSSFILKGSGWASSGYSNK
jgi:putative FmdB family regulatory protein